MGLSQGSDTLYGQGLVGRLPRNPPAGSQHVASDGEFVGWGAGIAKGVVEDEVFEIDEFAVDPQRGAGVSEVLPFKEAGANRRAGDALVQTRQSNTGVKSRPHQGIHADFREIIRH